MKVSGSQLHVITNIIGLPLQLNTLPLNWVKQTHLAPVVHGLQPLPLHHKQPGSVICLMVMMGLLRGTRVVQIVLRGVSIVVMTVGHRKSGG